MALRLIMTAVLAMSFLTACGSSDEGPGSPGSWGSEKTNVRLDMRVLCPEGVECGVDGDVTKADLCYPSDSRASLSINATTIHPEIRPGTQYVERYSIEYFTQTLGAPPIERFDSGYVLTPISLYNGTASARINTFVMDANRKDKYAKAIISGQYKPVDPFPNYVSKYTIYGKDEYGNGFGAVSHLTFWVGQYGIANGPCDISAIYNGAAN